MKQEIAPLGTHYLALGALALTLASAPARADWVTVRPDGSTQTTKNAPQNDNDNHDDSYDGPGRLKATKKMSAKRDKFSIFDPPVIDNRFHVGGPNNTFEPGRVQSSNSVTYVPGYGQTYVPPGYVIPQYPYPQYTYPPANTTVIVPGPAYNIPIGPPPTVPNWANPNYNTQPYITSAPQGTTIYTQNYPGYAPYGYCPPAVYPPQAYYPPPVYGYPTNGYPVYGYPNGSRTTTYGSVTIGGQRGGITFGGSNTTSTNSYSVRVGGR